MTSDESGTGWHEYRRLVLAELERLDDGYQKSRREAGQARQGTRREGVGDQSRIADAPDQSEHLRRAGRCDFQHARRHRHRVDLSLADDTATLRVKP